MLNEWTTDTAGKEVAYRNMLGADRFGKQQGWHLANEIVDGIGPLKMEKLAVMLYRKPDSLEASLCHEQLEQMLAGETAVALAHLTLSELKDQGYAHMQPEEKFVQGMLTGLRQRFYERVRACTPVGDRSRSA